MRILMNNSIEAFKGNNLTQKYETDLGYDIKAGDSYEIPPKCSQAVYTGLRLHIPEYLGGIIQSRSGLAFNESIEASNAGVIDSGYHNVCWVKLYNHATNKTKRITTGDRIAQIIFHINIKHFLTLLRNIDWMRKDFFEFHIIETDLKDFPKSNRDLNGLGSTGK